jgi:hypothetical protein
VAGSTKDLVHEIRQQQCRQHAQRARCRLWQLLSHCTVKRRVRGAHVALVHAMLAEMCSRHKFMEWSRLQCHRTGQQ